MNGSVSVHAQCAKHTFPAPAKIATYRNSSAAREVHFPSSATFQHRYNSFLAPACKKCTKYTSPDLVRKSQLFSTSAVRKVHFAAPARIYQLSSTRALREVQFPSSSSKELAGKLSLLLWALSLVRILEGMVHVMSTTMQSSQGRF